MLKKTFIAIVFLFMASVSFSQQAFQVQFVNEFGVHVDMGTDVSINVYNAGTEVNASIYLDKRRQIAVTQPITDDSTNTPLIYNAGIMTFYKRSPGYKMVVTDGTYTRTIDNISQQSFLVHWPTFMTEFGGFFTELTGSSNRDILFKNGTSWDTTTLSVFGQSLIDDATATLAQTTLGLLIGTNTQAWNGNLDDIAALTPTLGYQMTGDGTDFQVQSKPMIDVRDYGANGFKVGNTAAQNTAAIDAAFLVSNKLLLPTGEYACDPFQMSVNYSHLKGSGLTRLVFSNVSSPAISVYNGSSAFERCTIENVWLDGDSVSPVGGLRIGTSTNTVAFMILNHCRISGFDDTNAYGITLESIQELNVNNVRITDNYYNITAPGTGYITSTVFDGSACYIGRAKKYGVYIAGACTNHSIIFKNQIFEGNDYDAIHADTNTADSNTRLSLILDHCYFEGNNAEGLGTAEIFVSGNAKAYKQPLLILDGCEWYTQGTPTLTSGTLVSSKEYTIVDWITDDDFTNIGGTNVDGTVFTTSGTTPTKWTNSSTVVATYDQINVDDVFLIVRENKGLDVSKITDTSDTRGYYENNSYATHNAASTRPLYLALNGKNYVDDADFNSLRFDIGDRDFVNDVNIGGTLDVVGDLTATEIVGPVHITSAVNTNPFEIETTVSNPNTVWGVGKFHLTSTGEMTDLFGTDLSWILEDVNAVENTVAAVRVYRDGADDAGEFEIWTKPTAGVLAKSFRVDSTGNAYVTGDLTVTDDDIKATTNTTGYIWRADGTEYSPVSFVNSSDLAGFLSDEEGTGGGFVRATSPTLTTPTLSGDTNGGGGYITDMQNVPDIIAKGPGYWFDGTDDVITVSDNTDLDLTVKMSVVSVVRPMEVASQGIIGKRIQGSDDAYTFQITSTGKVGFYLWTSAGYTDTESPVSTYEAGKTYVLSGTYDGATVNIYSNGKEVGEGFTSGSIDATTDDVTVGRAYSTSFTFHGSIFSNKLFNLALDNTDSTDKAVINGGDIPYKYIGASQTATATTAFAIGKAYRIVVVGDTDFTAIGASANTIGIEFVATGVGGGTTGTATPIGCVLQLEPDSITGATWHDKSGNSLDGTVSEAVANNLFDTLQVNSAIELGHDTANTLSASSGELSIEGVQLAKLDGGLQDLDTLGVAAADGEIIVATGAGALAWEKDATARTSLGVGTGDSPQFTGVNVGHENDNTLTRIEAGVLGVENAVRSTTATYLRVHHVELYGASPGASGATFVPPDANRTGGWQLDVATEYVYGESVIHSDWDGATNPIVEVHFTVNTDNTGGAGTDTCDGIIEFYYKGNGDDECKRQTVEGSKVIGTASQYQQFSIDIPLDWDYADNVIEAGDILGFRFNLETDTSEVDDVTVANISFRYATSHLGVEDGDF